MYLLIMSLSAFSTNSHTTHQGQLVYAKPHNACTPVTPVETNRTLFAFIDEYLTCRDVVVSDTVLALFLSSSESADERTRACELTRNIGRVKVELLHF